MGDFDLWRGIEDRRGSVEAVRENSSRPARAWATYKSTGVGSNVEEKAFVFGCAFLEMPIFTSGAVYDADGEDFPATTPPTAFAGVYDWKQNADDFYTGAYCWFVVTPDPADLLTHANLKMIFTLSWEGVASKDFISATGFIVPALEI